jgi:hypothetical protein
MTIIVRCSALITCLLLLVACGTTDSTMRQAGHNEAYVQGFHDGRHSGMQEAGNSWEHYIRDKQRFDTDSEYRAGWIAGETEGKSLQAQAQSIGNSAAGAYSGQRVSEEVDQAQPAPQKIANDVMQGVDTSELKSLQ